MSEQQPAGAPTRVFLVDDHEVVRRGLRDLIDDEPDPEAVGEAATAARALARGPALRPDVAVLDVRLPDGDGITVCRELRSAMPGLACLMLTSFDDEDALIDAIRAGAAGYVLKQIKGSDPVSAVRTVATRQPMLDRRGRLGRRYGGDPLVRARSEAVRRHLPGAGLRLTPPGLRPRCGALRDVRVDAGAVTLSGRIRGSALVPLAARTALGAEGVVGVRCALVTGSGERTAS
ncbi:response regulator [Streptomyces cinereoruber]|uniref:response regulator n=1 Tax=Streptomyces cinereoruber TaxID=67260 RepID=UPI00362DDCA8